MFKYLVNKSLKSMSQRYEYDVRYMQDILQKDVSAFIKFMGFQIMASHNGNLPKEIAYAVRLTSIMWDDCGSCTQLIVDMALEANVDPDLLKAIISKDYDTLDNMTSLVVHYTEMVLSHHPDADTLRDDIKYLWGTQGLVAIGFCISTTRVYPALKYALGYGKACIKIRLADELVKPSHKPFNKAGEQGE